MDDMFVTLYLEPPTTQAAKARHAIERGIATLELAPGSVVSEREVGERTGYGKAPVREALQRLAGDGLVSPRPGSGYLIAPITLAGVRHLFEMWRVVEPAAMSSEFARSASGRPVSSILAALQHRTPHFHPRPKNDPAAAANVEVAIHTLLVLAAGNPWFTKMMIAAAVDMERVLRFAIALGARLDGAAADHDVIVEAYLQGDAPVARSLATEHVNRIHATVLDALVNSGANLAVDLPVDG